MSKAATILVLGDPGPVRDELLLRREIDVVWGASFRDAQEILRVCRVEACIIAPEFERLDGFEAFLKSAKSLPCIVRRSARAATPEGVWPSEEVEPVLAFLARHTGLVFARYPRAVLRLPVTAEIQGEKHHLETLNLSVSGVALRSFPAVRPGTRAELCIELPERSVYLLARVVRVLEQNGERRAGLSFTDLPEGLRSALARCVEAALVEDETEGTIFGDLEIPMPRSLKPEQSHETGEPVYVEEGDPAPLSSPAIRTLTESELTGSFLPTWIEQVANDLSELERLAALGGEAPDWAHRVLRLRIDLARARAEASGEIPPALIDETYRTFSGLLEETHDAPLPVQQQVSSIRASLLRDVLGVS